MQYFWNHTISVLVNFSSSTLLHCFVALSQDCVRNTTTSHLQPQKESVPVCSIIDARWTNSCTPSSSLNFAWLLYTRYPCQCFNILQSFGGRSDSSQWVGHKQPLFCVGACKGSCFWSLLSCSPYLNRNRHTITKCWNDWLHCDHSHSESFAVCLGYFSDFCAKYSHYYFFINNYNTQKLICSTCCSSITANCRLINLAIC